MSADIRSREQALHTALEASDETSLAELFADDLLYVHHQGIGESRTAVLTGVRTGLYAYTSLTSRDARTSVYGTDLAVTVGTLDVIDSHRPTERATMRQTLTWRRRDGRWMLVRRIATLMRVTSASESKEEA